ncbi:InlB B-repeat-containing protein [Paenibacillus sinopodophylli]|uniref:InlB B-repeat-containing protein n=1 Tax=Paenibacillus sinopodophylli TaxID=1837342 RepID=UPI001485F9F5|nr:InlB B-repeat-containing protein [Paenibacillus sinopodophylli]
MYKRLLSLVLLSCILLTLVSPGTSAASLTSNEPAAAQTTAKSVPQSLFQDVAPSAWSYDAVAYVKQNGLFSGTSNDLFSPDAPMSRAMYVTVLGRIAKVDSNQYKTSAFKDVQPDAWYAPYVQWATENGITSGTGSSKFSPDTAISREQMAVLTWKYFESDRIPYQTTVSTSKPYDLSDISPWAVDATVKLWQAGLFNGDANGNFEPNAKATRAEAAALFMRTDKVAKASNSITYTVAFDSNGGSPIDSLSLNRGDSLNQLPLAFKEGSIFNGWYKDRTFTQPVMKHDTVKSDMTLYANYIASLDAAVKSTPNTYAMEQAPNFKIAVKDSSGKMTAAAVQAAMTFTSPSNPDFAGITVAGSNGSFTVAAKNGVFEEGSTYQITLNDASLTFTGKDSTTKNYIFSIAKQEVLRLPLNPYLIYVKFSDISQMNQNGVSVATPSIAVMSANVSGGAGSSPSPVASGTFRYDGNTRLKVGDTVSVYEGTRPDLRTLHTSDDGDIAYIAITAIKGDIYSYTGANPMNVLLKPNVLPVDPASDTDGDKTNRSITVAPASMDYSDAKYAPMGLHAATVARVGDYLALVNMRTGASSGYGKVTSVSSLGNQYVITYSDASQDDITHALDFYKQETINGADLLSQAEITALENQIKRQALASGFVDKAANQLSTAALQTDSFKRLSAASAPTAMLNSKKPEVRTLSTVSGEETADVTLHNLQVSANAGTTLSHFKEKSGIRLNLAVSSDIQVSTGGENDILIHMNAAFTEEISLSVGVNGSTVWGYIDLGLFDLPYPKDYQASANLDAFTFTSIDASAQIGTVAADTPLNAYANIWNNAKNKVDIKAQLKAVLEQTPSTTAAVNASTLVESYQAMLENETDWVDLVEEEIFEYDKHLLMGLLHINFKGNFVISMNPNIALGIGFSYESGKRYTASFKLSEGSPSFGTVDLPGDGTYDFYFYVMGTLGLKAGIRLDLAAGLFHVELDSVGITAEGGAYLQLYGYFYYEVSSSAQAKTLGALVLEIGMYVEAEWGAQIFGGSISYSDPFYSEYWPLYRAGTPNGHFIDFAYEEQEAPSFVAFEEKSFPSIDDAFKLKDLNLITGEIITGKDRPQHYTITFNNNKFTYNPNTSRVTVSPAATDEILTGRMTVTWKGSNTGLNSLPFSRNVNLTWYKSGYGSIQLNANVLVTDEIQMYNFGRVVLPVNASVKKENRLTKVPKVTGFTFKGWALDAAGTKPYIIPDTMPSGNMTLYAQWTPHTNIPYLVDYITVDPNTGDRSTWKMDTFFGKAGDSVSPVPIKIEGYDTPKAQTITIAGTGSTKLSYEYLPATRKMTFYADPGGASIVYSARGYSQVHASAVPSFTKPGYTFAGWSKAIPSTMPSSDTTYTATWKVRTDIPYRVSNRLQGLGSTSLYVEADTGSFQGTTGALAAPATQQYPGFTYDHSTAYDSSGKALAASTVAADGSLTIVRYYTRSSYNLTFDAKGGTGGATTRVQYGADIKAPTTTRSGCSFNGWSPALASTMPAQDISYSALWNCSTPAPAPTPVPTPVPTPSPTPTPVLSVAKLVLSNTNGNVSVGSVSAPSMLTVAQLLSGLTVSPYASARVLEEDLTPVTDQNSDITSSMIVRVTAQNSSTADYVILYNDLTLTTTSQSYQINPVAGTITVPLYTYYGTFTRDVVGPLNGSYTAYHQDNTEITHDNLRNTDRLIVTAQDGTQKMYTFVIQ